MELELKYVDISKIEWGDKTEILAGVLKVCREELAALIREDPRISDVNIELANPGDCVRIIGVKDVIEPRVKLDERGGYFGGMSAPVETTGQGVTLALSGAAVIVTGPRLQSVEGILDMSGNGAVYSPFSLTHNLVLWIETVEFEDWNQKKEVISLAAQKAAIYLAQAARELEPDRIKKYSWDPDAKTQLPKVGYIQLAIATHVMDNCLYGVDSCKLLPTVVSPLEVIDGAMTNAGCRLGGHKNTTYHQQNNPVIMEALENHNHEFTLAGVIIEPEPMNHKEKARNSTMAVNIASMLGWEAAIITKEQAGNPDADLMMACRKAEKAGIKTVLITDECAGAEGEAQGLADTTPEADAVITTGNCDNIIKLPPMEKTIGSYENIGKLSGTFPDSMAEDGSMSVEIIVIPGSCNEMGFGYLKCKTI